MQDARRALTPDALAMLMSIARTGSFAAAARELGKVPSAVTYSVRQLEDALDVLLFDRRSRQAKLTAAGQELLDEGTRLLEQMGAVANRVKRVATGWETQLSIAVDDICSPSVMIDLCESFYACTTRDVPATRPPEVCDGQDTGAGELKPPTTRLRLRTEVLAGTWEALVSGRADLVIGVAGRGEPLPGLSVQPLGSVRFVFVVAPHHPLAAATGPIADGVLERQRAVAVADTARDLAPLSVNLLPGQDVLTVPDQRMKNEALVRGLGCGFAPEPMVRDLIAAGRLVVKPVQRLRADTELFYAWRTPRPSRAMRKAPPLGLALRWWLEQLESPATRKALIEQHDERRAP